MTSDSVTPRVLAALEVLATSDEWTPSQFAYTLFPDKPWVRASGNYGLGPDASGRTGGRIITRLVRLGLARFVWHHGGYYYTASITGEGLEALSNRTKGLDQLTASVMSIKGEE